MQLKPLINILIRTCGREILFLRCLKSITDQNYPNLRVIVSVDRDGIDYIPDWCEVVRVVPDKSIPFYYDRYINTLKSIITDGYMLVLDDDDMMAYNALNNVVLDAPAIIHRLNHIGRVVPPNDSITIGLIGFPCLMLHHSLKDIADIDTDDHCDYHWIKRIESLVPLVYRDLILVESDRKSNGVVEL